MNYDSSMPSAPKSRPRLRSLPRRAAVSPSLEVLIGTAVGQVNRFREKKEILFSLGPSVPGYERILNYIHDEYALLHGDFFR